MKALEDYHFVIPIRARFRDTDAMGHVNHAVYFSYLEEARSGYLREVAGVASYRDSAIILVHARCDYRAPLYAGEEVQVGARVERIGGKSFDMVYRLVAPSDGRLVAEAFTTQVSYDYGAARTVDVPPELRRQLSDFEGQSL